MKIEYKNRKLRHSLIFSLVWLTLGTLSMIFHPKGFLNYGYFLFGIGYLSIFLFSKFKQYLTIENGVITKNNVISKSLNLNEIKVIRKFAGDYILKTDSEEMTINTQIIKEESLEDLNKILKDLNLNNAKDL